MTRDEKQRVNIFRWGARIAALTLICLTIITVGYAVNFEFSSFLLVMLGLFFDKLGGHFVRAGIEDDETFSDRLSR